MAVARTGGFPLPATLPERGAIARILAWEMVEAGANSEFPCPRPGWSCGGRASYMVALIAPVPEVALGLGPTGPAAPV